MNPDRELRRAIAWLNNEGGFQNQIQYMKVADASQGLPFPIVQSIIRLLLEKRDEVGDPTAWVCASLAKERLGKGKGHAGSGGGASEAAWGQGGWSGAAWAGSEGWSGEASADWSGPGGASWSGSGKDWSRPAAESWSGKGGKNWSAPGGKSWSGPKGNNWSGKGGKHWAGPGSKNWAEPGGESWSGPASENWSAPGGADWAEPADANSSAPGNEDWSESGGDWCPGSEDWSGPSGEEWPAGKIANPIDPDDLWQRVEWLNNEGGFHNTIRHAEVSEAAAGLDTDTVTTILRNLEDKRNEVNDPTEWVCGALRKERTKATPEDPQGSASWPSTEGNASWPAGEDDSTNKEDAEQADQRLRKRLAWLNGEGGFNGKLKYEQVADVAANVDINVVMKILSHLVDKKEEVNDPTAWVCAALVKEGNLSKTKGGAWKGGQWSTQSDADTNKEVRKRIAWLNNEGGFNNVINYDEIAEAAAGVHVSTVMKIFSHLQDKCGEISNPTSWVCAALVKERNGKGARGNPRAKGSYGKGPWGKDGKDSGKGYVGKPLEVQKQIFKR